MSLPDRGLLKLINMASGSGAGHLIALLHEDNQQLQVLQRLSLDLLLFIAYFGGSLLF